MGNKYKKIGLLHHIGGGNLGDDATQNAVLHNIRQRWPEAQVFGFSMNPEDTQRRHGISSYPIRRTTWNIGYRIDKSQLSAKEKLKYALKRHPYLFGVLKTTHAVAIRAPKECLQEIAFLWGSFNTLRSFDLLIVNGGGQLTEWFGPWHFPYTIFKWILLARMAKVKRIILNVGAGPLTHPLSKFFVRSALRLADYVSFRDEESRALAHQIGFTARSQVFPDSAYSLATPAVTRCGAIPRAGTAMVGVAPMPYYDPRVYPEKDQRVYDDFIRKLGQFCAWLIRNDYGVALFGSDVGQDPLAIEDLRAALTNGVDTRDLDRVVNLNIAAASVQDLVAYMASLDYVVACRFHEVVFAHILNKPVLAISHHPKVATLMNEIGLGKYCVEMRGFDLVLLRATFRSLVTSTEEVKRVMAERLTIYRRNLGVQFDALFAAEMPRRTDSMPGLNASC